MLTFQYDKATNQPTVFSFHSNPKVWKIPLGFLFWLEFSTSKIVGMCYVHLVWRGSFYVAATCMSMPRLRNKRGEGLTPGVWQYLRKFMTKIVGFHPIYLSLYTYLPIYLPTYLPIYLSTYLPIHLSIHPSVYLSDVKSASPISRMWKRTLCHLRMLPLLQHKQVSP